MRERLAVTTTDPPQVADSSNPPTQVGPATSIFAGAPSWLRVAGSTGWLVFCLGQESVIERRGLGP